MAGALIVTAELGPEDFAWLDRLRRKHFPPERNQISAHLTIFHALPPSSETEVRTELTRLARGPAPKARIDGLMDLGGGVAFRVVSGELDHLRRDLGDCFRGLLTAQDAGGWRPHITVQNKVQNSISRALLAHLQQEFRPRSLLISGLGLHRYLGGPWETVATFSFRGT